MCPPSHRHTARKLSRKRRASFLRRAAKLRTNTRPISSEIPLRAIDQCSRSRHPSSSPLVHFAMLRRRARANGLRRLNEHRWASSPISHPTWLRRLTGKNHAQRKRRRPLLFNRSVPRLVADHRRKPLKVRRCQRPPSVHQVRYQHQPLRMDPRACLVVLAAADRQLSLVRCQPERAVAKLVHRRQHWARVRQVELRLIRCSNFLKRLQTQQGHRSTQRLLVAVGHLRRLHLRLRSLSGIQWDRRMPNRPRHPSTARRLPRLRPRLQRWADRWAGVVECPWRHRHSARHRPRRLQHP